jgi:hypothetical protein
MSLRVNVILALWQTPSFRSLRMRWIMAMRTSKALVSGGSISRVAGLWEATRGMTR